MIIREWQAVPIGRKLNRKEMFRAQVVSEACLYE